LLNGLRGLAAFVSLLPRRHPFLDEVYGGADGDVGAGVCFCDEQCFLFLMQALAGDFCREDTAVNQGSIRVSKISGVKPSAWNAVSCKMEVVVRGRRQARHEWRWSINIAEPHFSQREALSLFSWWQVGPIFELFM